MSFYTKDKKYTKTQQVTKCKTCKDTSFELLENKKATGKCCRCGKEYYGKSN